MLVAAAETSRNGGSRNESRVWCSPDLGRVLHQMNVQQTAWCKELAGAAPCAGSADTQWLTLEALAEEKRAFNATRFSAIAVPPRPTFGVVMEGLQNWYRIEALASRTPFAAMIPCAHLTPSELCRAFEYFSFRQFYVMTLPLSRPFSVLSQALIKTPIHVPKLLTSKSTAGPLPYTKRMCRHNDDVIHLVQYSAELREALELTPCFFISSHPIESSICIHCTVVDGVCVVAEVTTSDSIHHFIRPYPGLDPLSITRHDDISGGAKTSAAPSLERERAALSQFNFDKLADAVKSYIHEKLRPHFKRRTYRVLLIGSLKAESQLLPPPQHRFSVFEPSLDRPMPPKLHRDDFRFSLFAVEPADGTEMECFSPEEVLSAARYILGRRSDSQKPVSLPPVVRFIPQMAAPWPDPCRGHLRDSLPQSARKAPCMHHGEYQGFRESPRALKSPQAYPNLSSNPLTGESDSSDDQVPAAVNSVYDPRRESIIHDSAYEPLRAAATGGSPSISAQMLASAKTNGGTHRDPISEIISGQAVRAPPPLPPPSVIPAVQSKTTYGANNDRSRNGYDSPPTAVGNTSRTKRSQREPFPTQEEILAMQRSKHPSQLYPTYDFRQPSPNSKALLSFCSSSLTSGAASGATPNTSPIPKSLRRRNTSRPSDDEKKRQKNDARTPSPQSNTKDRRSPRSVRGYEEESPKKSQRESVTPSARSVRGYEEESVKKSRRDGAPPLAPMSLKKNMYGWPSLSRAREDRCGGSLLESSRASQRPSCVRVVRLAKDAVLESVASIPVAFEDHESIVMSLRNSITSHGDLQDPLTRNGKAVDGFSVDDVHRASRRSPSSSACSTPSEEVCEAETDGSAAEEDAYESWDSPERKSVATDRLVASERVEADAPGTNEEITADEEHVVSESGTFDGDRDVATAPAQRDVCDEKCSIAESDSSFIRSGQRQREPFFDQNGCSDSLRYNDRQNSASDGGAKHSEDSSTQSVRDGRNEPLTAGREDEPTNTEKRKQPRVVIRKSFVPPQEKAEGTTPLAQSAENLPVSRDANRLSQRQPNGVPVMHYRPKRASENLVRTPSTVSHNAPSGQASAAGTGEHPDVEGMEGAARASYPRNESTWPTMEVSTTEFESVNDVRYTCAPNAESCDPNEKSTAIALVEDTSNTVSPSRGKNGIPGVLGAAALVLAASALLVKRMQEAGETPTHTN